MRQDEQDKHRYDDIINLEHHVSAGRPHMSRRDRAAQFSSFQALTGFGAAITETGRLTEKKAELDEHEKAELDCKLRDIALRLSEQPAVTITYFQPDEKKAGGAYISVTDIIKKLDGHTRAVILQNGASIPFDDITGIEEAADRGTED